MTINQALDAVDALQPNAYSRQEKIGWLSRLETMVKAQILDRYPASPDFAGFGPDTDPETVLFVPEPWDEMYIRYIQAQMDNANGELARYANSAALFNGLFADYRNHYNHSHAPKGTGWKYF